MEDFLTIFIDKRTSTSCLFCLKPPAATRSSRCDPKTILFVYSFFILTLFFYFIQLLDEGKLEHKDSLLKEFSTPAGANRLLHFSHFEKFKVCLMNFVFFLFEIHLFID